jgi:hypothetical protein
LLAADVFAAALEAILGDDWCRTWAAGKTIIFSRSRYYRRQELGALEK